MHACRIRGYMFNNTYQGIKHTSRKKLNQLLILQYCPPREIYLLIIIILYFY